MDRKHNVLFGTLAVQYRLLTPRQLQPIAQQWAADPSRDLVEYLSDSDLISAKDVAFVKSAVDRALDSHNGDSDAAIKACGGADSVFAFDPNGGSQGSSGIDVSELLKADPASDPSNTPTLQDDSSRPKEKASGKIATTPPPRSAYVDLPGGKPQAVIEAEGRYSLIEEYARGGMGRVLLVHDTHIGRDIALKELLPERAGSTSTGATPQTNPILARFVQEARITGQLEHPSIVPVYELGYREDGTLYYTMKLVRGKTLAVALRACKGLRDRLNLLSHFVDLCQAIGYAHSRKVIHRDLKPGNIMVGEFGETVVIDWGLAKIQGKPDDAREAMSETIQVFRLGEEQAAAKTQEGLAMGTPAYMAPEQARGDLDNVGERSDVYALGAVLYELLTGRPPYAGKSSRQIIEQVLTQEPVPVEAIESDAPPELAAICNRAMARDPAQRYATAKELAEEVTRFLSGSLVSAYDYTRKEQVLRYVKRHKAIFATAAAGLLIVFMIGIMYNVRLLSTNAELAALVDQEKEAREEADQARMEASASLNLAEDNFRVASAAIDRLFTDVSESEFLAAPGASPVRNKLLRGSLAYYQQLAESLSTKTPSPDMQRHLAEAYLRVADVAHSVGEDTEAQRSYTEAQTYLAKLLDADPGNAEYQALQAKSLHELAILQEDRGEFDAAMESNEQALALRQRLVEAYPEEPRYRRGLADSYNNLAMLYTAQNDLFKASQFSEMALEERQRLAEAFPDDDELRSEYAVSLSNHGLLKADEGFTDDALNHFIQALNMQDPLVRRSPDDPDLLEVQAHTQANIANLHYDEDRYDEAERMIAQAVDSYSHLGRLYPAIIEYQTNLASGLTTQGLIYRKRDNLEAALEPMTRALEIRKKISEEYPDRDIRKDLAHSYFNLGLLQIDLGIPETSLESLNEALRVHYLLKEEAPDSIDPYDEFQYKLVMTRAQFEYAKTLAEDRSTRNEANEKYELVLAHLDALEQEYPDLARDYPDQAEGLKEYRQVVEEGIQTATSQPTPRPAPKPAPEPEVTPAPTPQPAPQPVAQPQAEEEKLKDPLGKLFRGAKKKFNKLRRNN
jgi:eukaryotic-like serine/threonine-protein kinase